MPHLQLQSNGKSAIRWYEDRLQPDGSFTRVHVSRTLGHFPSQRAAMTAFQAQLPRIAAIPQGPYSTLSLADYIEHHFLPSVSVRLRASTHYGYQRLFAEHKELLPQLPLRDIRCVDVQQFIDRVHQVKGLGKNSLHNVKSWLSGCFKTAIRMGVLDHNPVRDVLLPRSTPQRETYAYSLDEIREMLRVVPGRAAAVIAVAAYTGLRRGELAGLKWEDYTGGMIHVRRSIWMGIEGPPKTRKSAAPVPVIPYLADILHDWEGTQIVEHGASCPWMFGMEPPDLASVEAREIRPFVPNWKGWHAARRGLATNLKRLGVEDVVIQAILRHSNVSTTQKHYIQTDRRDVAEAMSRLAEEIHADPSE